MLNFTTTAPVALNMLANRAMLAGVRISVWSARRVDKRVTAETNAAHNAASDAGRYNKALLAKDALAAVTAAASAARLAHYARTLPWMDDGARILPAAAYKDYADAMRTIRFQFETAVADFVANYDGFVQDARARLNGMFNPDEYPTADEIAGKFNFTTRVLPMPDAADFRVDLGDAVADAIRADITRDTQDALAAAQRDVWNRITTVVSHMVEKLNGYAPAMRPGDKVTGIFRDSLVENVRELVAILPALNLTNDATLTSVTARLERELCTHDADALRDNDGLRQETADNAAAILAEIADFLA
jgi:hypothetical protein